MIKTAGCTAVALILGLLVSCRSKPEAKAVHSTCNAPTEADELLSFISRLRHSDPDCALAATEAKGAMQESLRWRVLMLRADLLLDRSNGADEKVAAEISKLLASPVPPDVPSEEGAARVASLKGFALYRRGDFTQAVEANLDALGRIGNVADPCWRAELRAHHQAQAIPHVLSVQTRFIEAAQLLEDSKVDARLCADHYWETLIPFVEGSLYNEQSLYEKAVSAFRRCLDLSQANGFPQLVGNSLGNMALAYSNLGDTDRALEAFAKLEEFYKGRGSNLTKRDRQDRGRHEGHRARTYFLAKLYDQAEKSYKRAIDLSTEAADRLYSTRWRAELTTVYMEKPNPEYQSAKLLNAIVIKDVDPNKDLPVAEMAHLSEARLDRLRGDIASAQKAIDGLQEELGKNPKLTWQIQSERALILAAENHVPQARREFEAALQTANESSSSIGADEFRLTYFRQLLDVYQSYVQFLAEHNQSEDSLRVAELGHARLLSEKLHSSRAPVTKFDFTRVARAKNAVILSYSIAPEHSYLWVTNSHASKLVSLSVSESKLERLIDDHNFQILGERTIGEDVGGTDLYDALVAPAAEHGLIPPNSRIIIIPDGPLAKLNFETLIPPGKPAHYWVESANITVAPSLTLLLAKEQRGGVSPQSILLVGDAVQAVSDLPALGPLEIETIAGLYGSKCRKLTKGDATPNAFLKSGPGKYSWIHLSAHAISYPQSPLDSYIVLSKDGSGEYKLSAHDLAKLKLTANLVTLSACQSAGKNMPGEGLVGLTWAVLSAGAQTVVASLWSVGATSTKGLMIKFYTHLHNGEPAAEALHKAKLDMVQGGANAYDWAAFQLYSR